MLISIVSSTNHSQNVISVIEGDDVEIEIDIPRFRVDMKNKTKTGRPYCYNSPNLYCKDGKKCCTHVSQKKVWCCDKKLHCGKTPKTCVIRFL